jgi:hypothetical protein
VSHQVFLGEEEISDVSLATFYVFDKENAGSLTPGSGSPEVAAAAAVVAVVVEAAEGAVEADAPGAAAVVA